MWSSAHAQEIMHAAHEIKGPAVAHAILTTGELIAAFATA
jgi:hypothetical protein